MTNEERVQKTIHLEPTDKILSGPAIGNFVATYTGQKVLDLLYDDKMAAEAYERTFNELGGWDIISNGPNSAAAVLTSPMLKARIPGRDLPDDVLYQYVEQENMLPEDYDFAIDNGFNALQERLIRRMYQDRSLEEHQQLVQAAAKRTKAHMEKWLARGLARLSNPGGTVIFEYFSFQRSLSRIASDARRIPDKLEAAIKACQPDIIANSKKAVDASGIRRVQVANSRASATFISPKQFERFVLPSMLEFTYAMAEADIDVVLHLDSEWEAFLPYLKEFPRARCLAQFDGSTDIFKAKEALKDHMAIMGDVPPALLTLGEPEQVYGYCKKLIEGIGEDGAFILNSGCETPFNSKPENVRAMLKAGNELTWR